MSYTKHVISATHDALQDAAADFLEFCKNKKKFAFYGEIGAGKTTFIKQICNQLGVEDVVSSPTFAIVHEYIGDTGKVYHLDLYRIKNLDEAFEINVPGYLDDENYCFIEWPDLIESFLPEETVLVNFEVLDELNRRITIQRPE